MVVTTRHVTTGDSIREVTHKDDEEGGSLWQFHIGNGDYSAVSLQLVRLDTILKMDPTVAELSDLPMGFQARREDKGAPWVISRIA